MVLDHVTTITAPVFEKRTLFLDICLLGSNCSQDGAKRLDFLKKEKKPTKQAAQKHKCLGLPKFKMLNILYRMLGVMGNFLTV